MGARPGFCEACACACVHVRGPVIQAGPAATLSHDLIRTGREARTPRSPGPPRQLPQWGNGVRRQAAPRGGWVTCPHRGRPASCPSPRPNPSFQAPSVVPRDTGLGLRLPLDSCDAAHPRSLGTLAPLLTLTLLHASSRGLPGGGAERWGLVVGGGLQELRAASLPRSCPLRPRGKVRGTHVRSQPMGNLRTSPEEPAPPGVPSRPRPRIPAAPLGRMRLCFHCGGLRLPDRPGQPPRFPRRGSCQAAQANGTPPRTRTLTHAAAAPPHTPPPAARQSRSGFRAASLPPTGLHGLPTPPWERPLPSLVSPLPSEPP
ncbi:nascent polypeptide-associated complex subunit alpha, muscle-specific form-like [Heterocephalus glaber]|uniref:Nascent polypeptide-associated complex subunit alpha, muscle-specific form-like n=1 Tax=Heterocephalus glaber TaxID=10181 RepID=A0AAX6RK15_HETGA|nr:nascent polypeptide-associated complex subunit alpha, muscle-specific form-like [Heterocephalus glaber]XP_021095673.1 nascent polypeptide-associated complex subunit alpha, muscle-specific form-like [Heterocephalus glaber]XP_021095674.1 nascent polypeptide-associated complex subunit alpha, muscle-specific form-like [Heterocephalus glaber]XP_021095675.1 nascent polypeptide-associated complex subunit alpha, muscle-specific form-like [Heterocephalus glaber]XP_021095676.1 nascent polypeptide-asso